MSINWEPIQEFWHANPGLDWDSLKQAVEASQSAGKTPDRNTATEITDN